MSLKQYARGLWAAFLQAENPWASPNGMEENLRTIDDHLGLYTLAAPQTPGTELPPVPADGAGQIYTNGTYATYNGGTWKLYPPRMGIRAVLETGVDSWLNTGTSWEAFSVLDTAPAIEAAQAAIAPLAAAAQEAMNRAEAASDASNIAGKVYPTPEAGVAAGTGVPFGDFFNVRSPLNDSYMNEYQNVAGVATPTGKSYPTTAAVTAISDLIKKRAAPTGSGVVFRDRYGFGIGHLMKSGNFRTPMLEMVPGALSEGVVMRDRFGFVMFNSRAERTAIAEVLRHANQNVHVIGDSNSATARVELGDFGLGFLPNWPDFAFGSLQMAKLYNFAKSGASFREYSTQELWQKVSTQVDASLALGATEPPDTVIVALGTNDRLIDLGSYEEAMAFPTLDALYTAATMQRTYNAIRWAFWTLAEAYPNALLCTELPAQRTDYTLKQFEPLYTAIREMAAVYNFLVIPAQSESGISRQFEPGRDLRIEAGPGLHNTESGRIKRANLITRYIRNAYNY